MATLKDVARLAGVSVSTVSHVINGYNDINQETRARVLEAIKQLNYHRNSMAKGLVKRRSSLIGLIMFGEGISHPFFYQVVRGFIDEIEQRDFNAVLSRVDTENWDSAPILRKMHEHRMEGLVVMGVWESHPAAVAIAQCGIPTVFVDAMMEGRKIASVSSENRRGMYQATEYLIQLGHRRIGFVNVTSGARIFRDRLDGYKAALRDYGIEFDQGLYVESANFEEEGHKVTRDLLSREPGITAIVTASDRVALGVMEELRQEGFSVPGDISVVGFDDIDMARFSSPPLTTVRQHGETMGRRAARHLIDMIEDQNYLGSRITVDTELIIRESTGPARR